MTKRSPFPGMDPWLERRWGDVHLGLCSGIRGRLQPVLPPGLRAIGQEDIQLQSFGDDGTLTRKRIYPDSAVLEISGPSVESKPATSAAVAVAAGTMRRVTLPPVNRWVEIIDVENHDRIITAIEILSPGNKAAGTLNRKYLKKIVRYVNAGVNVVEIDLLRTTRDRLYTPTRDLPPQMQAEYFTMINRSSTPDDWAIHPMRLRDPLPAIPIPLRKGDREVALELQPLLDQVYADGGHYMNNYRARLSRSLPADDDEWAADLIAQSGR